MSLTSVLLIHVSTIFTAANDDDDEEHEFYSLLELPKYAPLTEIRKAHRRVSLQLQCDRMMLEWNNTASSGSDQEEGGTAAAAAAAAVATTLTSTAAAAMPSSSRSRSHRTAAEKALWKLDERERRIKRAFGILGDKHLRQQYHLLQCRPSRYKVIQGPLAVIRSITHPRRWFPFLILQSVIVYVFLYRV